MSPGGIPNTVRNYVHCMMVMKLARVLLSLSFTSPAKCCRGFTGSVLAKFDRLISIWGTQNDHLGESAQRDSHLCRGGQLYHHMGGETKGVRQRSFFPSRNAIADLR